jgi:hypothetical protein
MADSQYVQLEDLQQLRVQHHTGGFDHLEYRGYFLALPRLRPVIRAAPARGGLKSRRVHPPTLNQLSMGIGAVRASAFVLALIEPVRPEDFVATRCRWLCVR